jgi:putative NADPH-quinone reductase
MKVSVILGHPSPGSFNHALAGTVRDTLAGLGHEVRYHDLYEEGFDPVLPGDECPRDARLDRTIAAHCREIAEADGVVIVHPNWWGMPPAVLVGWVDRVLRPGVAYRFLPGDDGEGIPEGLLVARSALVLNTANTPAAREAEVFGDPLDAIWGRCIFPLCGVRVVERCMYRVVVTSTPGERAAWLDDARERTRRLFPSSGSRFSAGVEPFRSIPQP